MVVALNKGTKILIDNFIDKHFSGSDKVTIKQEALEIANSILEQSNVDLDKLATKGDLDKIETKINKLESKFEVKITETKYDLLRWIITAQVAIAGFLLAVIKFT